MNQPDDHIEKLSELNRSAAIITPNQQFFNHLSKMTNDETIKAQSPDQFDASTLYLIPHDLSDEQAYWDYLETVYMQILEEEVDGWVSSEQAWIRDVNYETFKTWFTISFQSMVFDTLDEELDYED